MKRINLTGRLADAGQECMPRTIHQAKEIRELLTFEDVPNLEELITRTHQLAAIATKAGATEAMIGGPPYLCLILDRVLRELYSILPVYAFKKTTIKFF